MKIFEFIVITLIAACSVSSTFGFNLRESEQNGFIQARELLPLLTCPAGKYLSSDNILTPICITCPVGTYTPTNIMPFWVLLPYDLE